MIRAHLLLLSSAFALTACTTTTSFAPPPVGIRYSGGSGDGATCPAGGRVRTTVTVTRDVQGTFDLVDAFVAALRCSAHASANGRQAFEIPAFLATTGAAVAVALGGGANYGIIGTGANSLFNAGKSYWDPKQKAAIYDHALDAILCVKTEAVGIEAIKNPPSLVAVAETFGVTKIATSSISVPVEEQYFMMVSAAVFTVERVLAQQLSNMAPVDAALVAAAIKQAIEEQQKAKNARDNPPPGTTPIADALHAAAIAEPDPTKRVGITILEGLIRDQEMAPLDLAVLKPKLDECVIRAKL